MIVKNLTVYKSQVFSGVNFLTLNKLSVKLDEIQKTVDDNSRTVSIINKIVYAAVVAIVGAYVAHVWM